jgi:hypothetical protein
MKRCASRKSPVQLKPQLRHLDRMPIDRAVRDAGHHVRHVVMSARAMVDRFLATA